MPDWGYDVLEGAISTSGGIMARWEGGKGKFKASVKVTNKRLFILVFYIQSQMILFLVSVRRCLQWTWIPKLKDQILVPVWGTISVRTIMMTLASAAELRSMDRLLGGTVDEEKAG
ncbi:hypothetical protein EDD18DRAFT_1101883 [Armillaria luteobubalina]|uniref:Uncharacterized protein n=1 Tax=Armillaria luteobubalina TaxID=153913 RepID=A0AA39USA8_9AGAR|nr:hypothetical protein EDD18DRAFT_1101883 [Armillaria luteobubalina]